MNPRERLKQLVAEMTDLRKKSQDGTLTEDEGKQFDEKVAEARTLKAQIDTLDRRAADGAFLDEQEQRTTEPARRLGGMQAADGKEQRTGQADEAPETRTVSQRFLESDVYKLFAQRGHRGPTEPVQVGSFFHRAAARIAHRHGLSPQEQRTIFAAAALGTDQIAPQRLPTVYVPNLPEFNVRDAFINGQTNSNVIQFWRELTYTNNAAFVSAATATSGSSGLKPESALTYERATAPVEVLAHWIPVENSTMDDLPQMESVIEGRLIDGLRIVEDDALINGDGTPPNISGLLDMSGTQVADDAYFAGEPVVNTGAAWQDFDRITRARRLVRITGRARPTFLLISPADLERLLTITDDNGQYFSGSPFSPLSLNSMRGLAVIETEALDEGTAIVGDGRMAAVWDRMAATVKVGLIDDQFVRNMHTLLAEERLAFTIYRPAAFVVLELTSAA